MAVQRILAYPKLGAWQLPQEAVLSAAQQIGSSERELFLMLLEQYRRSRGTPRCGWKTPTFEFHLGRFEEWFGESYRFVHLVRHPLDTYASNRWYGGEERHLYTEGWASQWVRSVSIAIRASITRKTRHRLVRYEDLVRATRQVLIELCEFLSLTPEIDRMLSMCDYEERDNSSFRGMAGRTRDGEIRQRDQVDRRGLLTPSEIETVRQMCGYPAELLGYDLEAAHGMSAVRRATSAMDELPLARVLATICRYGARRVTAGARRTLIKRFRRGS